MKMTSATTLAVAQISNLLYRRFAIGRASERSGAFRFPGNRQPPQSTTTPLASSQGSRRPKPRRGGLFIDGGTPPDCSFCFSAARTLNERTHLEAGSDRACAARYGLGRAAEKQKEKRAGGGVCYKQVTPTGFEICAAA